MVGQKPWNGQRSQINSSCFIAMAKNSSIYNWSGSEQQLLATNWQVWRVDETILSLWCKVIFGWQK